MRASKDLQTWQDPSPQAFEHKMNELRRIFNLRKKATAATVKMEMLNMMAREHLEPEGRSEKKAQLRKLQQIGLAGILAQH